MDSGKYDKDDSSHARPKSIDIELQFGTHPQKEVEVIPNVSEPFLMFNCACEVLLAPILSHLKHLGFPLDNSMVWYYSPCARLEVYCGNDPLPSSVSIPEFEIQNSLLKVICKEPIKNEFGTMVTIGSSPTVKIRQEEDVSHNHKTSRRTKERKIGYIIEKVSKWRKLYNGTPNAKGELVKLTLEEAANKVSISKKSLDDYLLQLRFGRKFGFNFQEHKDDKVGVLRAYVKKFKALQQYSKKIREGHSIPVEVIKKLQEPGTPACKHNRCCAPEFALNFKQGDPQNYSQIS
mmetsp:Transcript_9288/g.13813  ORF Transcript_9288/g.13813 Transcript_9288/m.13813 type:complete len:291 (-) Transcript_9288:36-908(-)